MIHSRASYRRNPHGNTRQKSVGHETTDESALLGFICSPPVDHKSHVQSLAVVLRGAFSLLSDSYNMYVQRSRRRSCAK